jgi:hypothetical protein
MKNLAENNHSFLVDQPMGTIRLAPERIAHKVNRQNTYLQDKMP